MSGFVQDRRMRRGELAAFPTGGGPVEVACAAGRAWATVDGDARDHVLEAGAAARLAGPGTLVVEALAEGTVVLVRPARLGAAA
jgi:hypothetical protein